MLRIAFFVSLLLPVASMRLATIVNQPRLPMDLGAIRNQVEDLLRQDAWPLTKSQWSQLRTHGVEQIIFQSFRAEPLVVMRGGRDRQPGVAGVDDNANGSFDDVLELGATLSDDVCQVEVPDEHGQLGDGPVLILQQGAFTAATWNQFQRATARRVIVTGRDDDPWSFIIAIPGS